MHAGGRVGILDAKKQNNNSSNISHDRHLAFLRR
jgi:hypothetical protein